MVTQGRLYRFRYEKLSKQGAKRKERMKKHEQQTNRLEKMSNFFGGSNFSKLNLYKTTNRYALVLLSCVLAVAGLIFLAMAAYPVPYSWPKYYLSALGLTVLKNGTANPVSSLLFNFALILAGVMTASYFYVRGGCSRWKIVKYLLWTAGIVGGAGLAGVGVFPYNRAPDVHNWCTFIASGGLVSAVILTLGTIGKSKITASETVLWVIFGFFTLLVWGALATVRAQSLVPSTPTGQIQQKILVAFFWLYMFWNSLTLFLRTRVEA